MTAQTVATLKTYFQTGDKPTQSQFGDVMDSFVSFLDTSAQSVVSDFNIGGSITVSGNASVNGTAIFANIGSSSVIATGGSAARTLSAHFSDILNVVDFGADPTGVSDSTTAFSSAIASISTNGTIYIAQGTYKLSASLTLPQGKFITFKGAGFRNTILSMITDGVNLFNYVRSGSPSAAFVWRDISFVLADASKTANSNAISSFGNSDSLSDNEIRVEDCYFMGWATAIISKWTGQSHIIGCFFQGNTTSLSLARGCSFWYIYRNMSFDATFIFAQDTTYDDFSNGLFIDSSHGITNTADSVYVEGYQSVYFSKCGYDLGSGADAAMHFKSCQDVTVNSCYISSNGSASRYGVYMDGSFRWVIRDSRIVNNSIGVQVFGVSGNGTIGVIDSNEFDGNATNDVILNTNSTICKVFKNHFNKQQSRTGSNFEIYANTAGSDYHMIEWNTFVGTTYSIVVGANSLVGNNIFSVP